MLWGSWERGQALLASIGDLGLASDLDELARFDPLLPNYLVQFEFGEILSRPGIDPSTRMLCAIASLLVTRQQPLVEGAIRAALDAGATR